MTLPEPLMALLIGPIGMQELVILFVIALATFTVWRWGRRSR